MQFDVEDWMYEKIRYKQPDEDDSTLFTQMVGVKDYTDRQMTTSYSLQQ